MPQVINLQLYAPGILLVVIPALLYTWYKPSHPYAVPFWSIFGLYLIQDALIITGRLRHWLQKPSVKQKAQYKAKDVTIRISTVSPENKDFEECLRGVFKNRPAGLEIVTDTRSRADQVLRIVRRLNTCGVEVRVASAGKANKRVQMIYRIKDVKTPLIAFVDDHAFLPEEFFKKVLPVFDDPEVALCGTTKRVRREEPQVSGRFSLFQWYWKSSWNFSGAAYLAGHNTVFLALQVLDGGHYVISGRTMLGRTAGFQDETFRNEFLQEYRGFRGFKFGPLSAGDDNFITRWFRGKKIVFTDAATMETTLGESASKFIPQSVRWVRTTYQNAGEIWENLRQVKLATALTISGMVLRAPLLWDCLLVFLFQEVFAYQWQHTVCFLGFIWLTRLYKIVPYFLECPKDLIFVPAHLLFVYFHTLIGLYSAVTVRSCTWSGRTLGQDDEEGTEWLGDTDFEE